MVMAVIVVTMLIMILIILILVQCSQKNVKYKLLIFRMVFSFRINCYDLCMPQTPFGGFKQSGHGREL